MKKQDKRDTLVVVISDMHAGGTTALFPNRMLSWGREKPRNHTPNSKQLKIYDVFMQAAKYARENRGDRMVIVHNGDAIEGIHHQTTELVSHVWDDHVDTHIELMNDFFKASGWQRNKGDKLYYTIGTDSHTQSREEEIASYFEADGIHQHLSLEINGRRVDFLHHGPTKGKGANEGNPLRNFLRDLYWSCQKNNERPPDFIFTGHTHTPCYNTYVFDFHTIHGVICPSLQSKTKYAYQVAKAERNEIGVAFVKITANGDIRTPYILKQASEDVENISI